MTTPRKNKPSPELSEAAAALGSNLGDDDRVPDEFRSAGAGEDHPAVEQKAAPAKAAKKVEVPPEHAVKTQDRLWIKLEDNDDIPPGGQFIGVDGAGFLLRPGIEAWVPIGLCDVLDAAVKSVPVIDDLTRQITGWKDRLRFPYRVIRNKPAPSGWTKPR